MKRKPENSGLSKKRKITREEFYLPRELWINLSKYMFLKEYLEKLFLTCKQLNSIKKTVIQEKWKNIPEEYKIKLIDTYENKSLKNLMEFEYPTSDSVCICGTCRYPYADCYVIWCGKCEKYFCHECNEDEFAYTGCEDCDEHNLCIKCYKNLEHIKCQNCFNLCCKKHVIECKTCKKKLCGGCSNRCTDCHEWFCGDHSFRCEKSVNWNWYCKEHFNKKMTP